MEVKCRLNGENIVLRGEAADRLRDVLYHTGCYSVRDSDDAEGFAGSDTIIFNGQLKYSNFILLYQAEGAEIKTAESLLEKGELNYVQKAMVAAGIVQSAYNAPAAALILTWLLEKHPNPTRAQIKDVLTSIFIRDAGYEHYYLAVKLACELRDEGEFKTEIAPSFRPQLDIIGKPAGKIDGAALVSGEPVFVEDKVPANAWCLHVLRSPFASAYIKSIDTSEAEKLDGVAAIITAFNCPDVYYMQAGQGTPEPSPHDRRLFNMKVRHVGDRVAGIVARTAEIADKAASLIKVEYEPTDAVFTVEEAMEEADFVLGLLEDLEIDGPVAYDWEMHDSSYRVYGTSPEMATACAVAFCQRIEEAGYDAMVYAGQYVSYIKYDQGAIEPYLAWYPEYKSEKSENLCPSFYYQMDYWQFSSSCSIDGIGGRVDANLQFIPR